MKLKDLASVLYSNTGNIQWAVVWSITTGEDITDVCSIDYAVKHYPDYIVKRIQAVDNTLAIGVIAE